MNIKTIIDKNGDIKEICVIENENGGFYGYELKAGEKAVSYLNDALVTTNGIAHPPLKPKWNGKTWRDSATEQELEKEYPPKTEEPSDSQRIAQLEEALDLLLSGGTE